MSMSPSNLRASAGHKFGVSGAEIEVIRDAAVGGVDLRELASWVKNGGATVAAVIRGQLLPLQGPACRHRRPLGLGFVGLLGDAPLPTCHSTFKIRL